MPDRGGGGHGGISAAPQPHSPLHGLSYHMHTCAICMYA